jgi:hypothetical protein
MPVVALARYELSEITGVLVGVVTIAWSHWHPQTPSDVDESQKVQLLAVLVVELSGMVSESGD